MWTTYSRDRRSPIGGVSNPAGLRGRRDNGRVERPVDFSRDRQLLCRRCSHSWTVDLAWLERWRSAEECCPNCQVTCEAEDAGGVTVADGDPALNDDLVREFFWYHTTTESDWPAPIDFASRLEERTQQIMGGEERVAAWALRQSTKALHLGTYESAVHNMLRRMVDHHDRGKQFFLFRVQLRAGVDLSSGWVIDPSNFMGDVDIDESFSPGTEVGRYVNYHEDPGGLSLAIHPAAIGVTQRIEVPLADSAEQQWVLDAVERLSNTPPDPPTPDPYADLAAMFGISERQQAADNVRAELVEGLPINLRFQFESATHWNPGDDPAEWATYTFGLAQLVWDADAVLAELDAQTKHHF